MGNKASRRARTNNPDSSQSSDINTSQSSSHENDDRSAQPTRVGMFTMLKQGYSEIVNAIVRPPRAEYTLEELGPEQFTFMNRRFHREDLRLHNSRGQELVCSHWQPVDDDRPGQQLPCVIYLHGNSSCRLGALEAIDCVLTEGCTLFALDFAGSGLSDGEYVTLGHFEKDDVTCVVDYLRGTGRVSTIALWGRSMGAATALLHSHRDPSIAALILDSPFADLRQLANEMVARGKSEMGYSVPGFVISAAIRMVASSVWRKAKMDLNNLKPIADVDQAFIPALFCAAEDDDFIKPTHSEALHAKYAGDKNLILVTGGHNGLRPQFFQDSAAIFLRSAMLIPDNYALNPRSPASHVGHGILDEMSRRESVRSAWARAAHSLESFGSSFERPEADLERQMMQRITAASALFNRNQASSRRIIGQTPLTVSSDSVMSSSSSTPTSGYSKHTTEMNSVATSSESFHTPDVSAISAARAHEGCQDSTSSQPIAETRPSTNKESLNRNCIGTASSAGSVVAQSQSKSARPPLPGPYTNSTCTPKAPNVNNNSTKLERMLGFQVSNDENGGEFISPTLYNELLQHCAQMPEKQQIALLQGMEPSTSDSATVTQTSPQTKELKKQNRSSKQSTTIERPSRNQSHPQDSSDGSNTEHARAK